MSERRRSGDFAKAPTGEGRALERTTSFDGASGGLHRCPFCASALVYPIDWAPAPAGRWHVDLRCPNCEWRGEGAYEQDVVDRFDDTLERGTDALLADLHRLSRANHEDQIERFSAALVAGEILPEDF